MSDSVFGPWPTIFAFDLGRYLVVASLAFAVFWVWKWNAFAHRRIQPRRPSNARLLHEIKYSLVTGVIFATVGLVTFHLAGAGYLQRYEHVDDYGWPYWFVSIAIAIVLHDTYFYWTHRAMHTRWLYKHVHKVHHMSTNPSPWAAYSFSPLEALVEAGIAPVVFALVPMHGVAMFVFLGYMIVMNVLGHLGIELYPSWFATSRWTRSLTTATHHNLHHRDFHANYALYFTWWDRLMGTMHPRYEAEFARAAGGAAPVSTGSPETRV
jgi:sterol desaturase/sphingolipid hydroxylase (fatty acid hydroxylase superfamily)